MELVSFMMNSEDFPTLLQKTWLISLQTDLYCLKLFIPSFNKQRSQRIFFPFRIYLPRYLFKMLGCQMSTPWNLH